VGTQIFQKRFGAGPSAAGATSPRSVLAHAVGVFATFHFVCFCWVFFRAPTFSHALLVLERIGAHTFGTNNLSWRVISILVLGAATHFLPDGWIERVRVQFVRAPAWVQGVALVGVAYALHFAAGAKAEPFVYGQF
jgi:hypothetical protein